MILALMYQNPARACSFAPDRRPDRDMQKISLVVPVLDEVETVSLFHQAVSENKALSAFQLEIIFIDDGSTDGTAGAVKALRDKDPRVRLIEFTRNFGKEAAIFAGLEAATGDAVIPIDVDLQDPIEVIPSLVAKWQEGADVVLAKRSDRSEDSFLKRKTADWFYRFHNRISKVKIDENVGDFRLLSRDIVTELVKLPEKNLFMKGLLSWPGGKKAVVEYQRARRIAGKTKFNGWSLWNFALEGITSFSTVPLRIWTYIGMIVAFFSFLYASYIVVSKLVWDITVPGYASLLVAVLFIGGVQLISIGILGEYIGRIYMEVKGRPRYITRISNE